MRGGTLLAFIQEKPGSIAGHGAQGERGGPGGDLNVGAGLPAMHAPRFFRKGAVMLSLAGQLLQETGELFVLG
ncbi:hypothetical protein C6Y56_05080 [Pseudomonas fluorescens]|uniref:Uncharacterized protein n=1 Tax=Pseudomonas fluorescens TaxID=294 RepID=A0A7Z3C347_PSEFL|nr:hypothetical protein C6Y56_05080 [Pseudomonas fluorescens]